MKLAATALGKVEARVRSSSAANGGRPSCGGYSMRPCNIPSVAERPRALSAVAYSLGLFGHSAIPIPMQISPGRGMFNQTTAPKFPTLRNAGGAGCCRTPVVVEEGRLTLCG